MGSLLLLRKRPLFRDDFGGGVGAALSSQWTAALGAFDMDGAGRARGKTLAADGINLVSNPEFTTVTTGWTALNATLTRLDSEVTPGVNSGGADKWCMGVSVTGGTQGRGYQDHTLPAGVSYAASTRAYWPSANTAVKKALLALSGGFGNVNAYITAEDTWQALTATGTAGATANRVNLFADSATVGDVAYFDAVSLQATLAIATHDLGRASHDLRIRFITPASGVVPGGYIVRYQDLSNYWLWRVKPGTAGDDLELVEVNAAVATVRAGADIDWAVSTTFDLRLVSQANVYTAYVNNVSKATYTDAASFLATNTKIGLWSAGAANILTEQILAKAA